MLKTRVFCSFVFCCFTLVSQDLSEFYANNIDTVNLFNNLDYLASNKLKGRKTGEKGQKQAAAYIQAQFKKAGVLPFPEENYFQKFNLLL